MTSAWLRKTNFRTTKCRVLCTDGYYDSYSRRDGSSCTTTVIRPARGGDQYNARFCRFQNTNAPLDGLIVDPRPNMGEESHSQKKGVCACLSDVERFSIPRMCTASNSDGMVADLQPSWSLALPLIPWRWLVNAFSSLPAHRVRWPEKKTISPTWMVWSN